jgi:hypothetical protein
MSISRFVCLCGIVKSRTFIHMLFPLVGLSFMLSCIWFICALMACGWVHVVSYMIRMSSTYCVCSSMFFVSRNCFMYIYLKCCKNLCTRLYKDAWSTKHKKNPCSNLPIHKYTFLIPLLWLHVLGWMPSVTLHILQFGIVGVCVRARACARMHACTCTYTNICEGALTSSRPNVEKTNL